MKALSEITLRKFEKPKNESKRELIKKFCIALGLLQENDSRETVVDIFEFLLNKKNKFERVNVNQIIEFLKSKGIKVTEQNVRHHLRKLAELQIVEKIGKEYRIREFESLEKIVDDIFKYKIVPIIERIKEIAKEIENAKRNNL